MTDKETKALERCKELIKENHSCWIGLSNQDAINTILQLLEKQNTEIKEMREECKVCVVRNDLHNYIEEAEKKDKIIDKMAEEIFIKRALAITSEQDIDRLKQRIIEEYKSKV